MKDNSKKAYIFSVLKKYALIVVQALSVTLVSACICIYYFYSTAVILDADCNESTTNLSLMDLKDEYYESEIFVSNMDALISNVMKYAVIKGQLETEGEYDPYKIINIGEFAHRMDERPYNGPDACYYLQDLIAWGQFGISTSGISHSYKTFESWEELDEFFGNGGKSYAVYCDGEAKVSLYDTYGASDGNDVNTEYALITDSSDVSDTDYEWYVSASNNGTLITIEESEDSTIPMLDVISNRYLSADGQKLEYYASNPETYAALVESLEETAVSLYTNYRFYQDFLEFFNTDNSNVRFYISNNENVYTNLLNYKILDADKLDETFKNMGKYIYFSPRNLAFSANVPLNYDRVNAHLQEYSYFYSDNTVCYIGLDTTYTANDLFKTNYSNLKASIRNVPWVISFAALGLTLFIFILVIICINGKKRLSYEDSKYDLKFFDKFPIETEILTCAFLCMLIYLFNLYLIGDRSIRLIGSLKDALMQVGITSFLYAITGLLFLYSFIRRAYLHVLFKTSIIAGLFRWLNKRFSFVGRWFLRIYDSVGTAIRTWASYLFFLLFNTFWACMLFFSNIPVISFLVLLLFDGMVGIYLFNTNWERKKIVDALNTINSGDFDIKLDTTKMHGDNKEFANRVNQVGDAIRVAVETSSKDEKLKADLITNVSHDIKTPLTSIINYVGLIKRENIDNERVLNYIKVLDDKSQRLKQLTIDLVEASKITSGNITLELTKMNFVELVNQAQGEFEEKFSEKGLTLITTFPKTSAMINADPRYVWRIIENLLQNVYKYAMPDTRVYLDVVSDLEKEMLTMSLKNISNQQLNINADELTERFIRGDVARSSEGHGLGLSIVKSLVKAHNGTFEVYLDGDLFKATVQMPLYVNNESK